MAALQSFEPAEKGSDQQHHAAGNEMARSILTGRGQSLIRRGCSRDLR